MSPDVLDALVRALRRAPIADAVEIEPCLGTAAEVEGLLPHRPPFLLVDAVTGLDRAGRAVLGRYHVDPADPVFIGHFPGHPVYPGVLQVEAVSQLGLCGLALLSPSPEGPVQVRALKVHHALFLAEVAPGATLDLRARLVGDDSLTATVAGQVYAGGVLCSVTVMEAYFV